MSSRFFRIGDEVKCNCGCTLRGIVKSIDYDNDELHIDGFSLYFSEAEIVKTSDRTFIVRNPKNEPE